MPSTVFIGTALKIDSPSKSGENRHRFLYKSYRENIVSSPKVILFLCITTTLGLGLGIQAGSFEPLRALLSPVGWIGIARVVGVIAVLYMLWFPWFFERLVKTKTAEVFLREGKDPDGVIFLVTTVCCMTATSVGMMLYLLGTAVTEFWGFAGIAIAGILFWAWRYRTVVLKPTS